MSEVRIRHSTEELYFRGLPIAPIGARFERCELKGKPLAADVVLGASQAAGQFMIVHRAEKLDFAHGPASGPRFERDAQLLAHRDDFFDGAAPASREDGIGRFAEAFQFGKGPMRTSAALESDFCGSSHELFPLISCRRGWRTKKMDRIRGQQQNTEEKTESWPDRIILTESRGFVQRTEDGDRTTRPVTARHVTSELP